VFIDNAVIAEFQATTGSPGTGLFQLSGADLRFTVVPVNRVPPTPRVVSIQNVTEALEGQLIRLRNVTFQNAGSFAGDNNYVVLDNFGNQLDVRIDGGTEIATNFLPVPQGANDLIGVVSQFRGTFQIQPRYASDIGLADFERDTVSRSRTLDITTWNLEWFGWADSTRGPTDKVRQRESIQRVFDSLQADVYALQEIVSADTLVELVNNIAGTYQMFFANDITSEQKLAYVYNAETVKPLSAALAVNGGAQAWANGRFPYRFTFETTVDSKTMRVHCFNIHAKATDSATAESDWQRRKTDAETFHAYLRDFYGDSLVVVLGDFNDRVIGSNAGPTLGSSYEAFVNDTTNWTIQTKPLEEAGLASFVGFERSFIDHIITSNEAKLLVHRTRLESPQAYLSSYSSTVTDHVPVTTRMFVDNNTSVSETISPLLSARCAPNPASTNAQLELTITEVSNVHVVLVNTLGHVTTVLDEHLLPQVRLVSLPIQTLASGLYSAIIVCNGNRSVIPVVVVR
jgi:uncharacterized protein